MAGKFEYKVFTANIEHGKERQLEPLLNELGRGGWEAVSHSVAPLLDGSGAWAHWVVLKRPLG